MTHLHDRELVVEKQREQRAGEHEELHPEGVVVAVVGRLELDVHEIDRAPAGDQEEDLHGRVVERDEVGDQVQVSGHEQHGEQDLGPTWTAMNRNCQCRILNKTVSIQS